MCLTHLIAGSEQSVQMSLEVLDLSLGFFVGGVSPPGLSGHFAAISLVYGLL